MDPKTFPTCSGDEAGMERCPRCGVLIHCRSCGYGLAGRPCPTCGVRVPPARRLTDAIEAADRAGRTV